MNDKERKELYWIFAEIASEIRNLKESESEGSGENWHNRFMRILRLLEPKQEQPLL